MYILARAETGWWRTRTASSALSASANPTSARPSVIIVRFCTLAAVGSTRTPSPPRRNSSASRSPSAP